MNRWILASRPKTLIAAVAPVLLGAAYAGSLEQVSVTLAAIILADALLIQIVTNLANDVLDFEKGADTEERLGPQRMTQSGQISSRQMWRAIAILLTLAGILGLYLVFQGGLPILLIGISALILSVAYTGGPFPLAYHGLGDLFTFFYFGPIALGGTVYLLVDRLPLGALILGSACGLLSTAFLVVNNTRDYRGDMLAGKRTLIVRFGPEFGRYLYSICLFVALLAPACGVVLELLPHSTLFPLLFLLPSAYILARKMYRARSGAEYNMLLASTGILYWMFLILSVIPLLAFAL